jgi:aminopeptidase N
LIGSDDLGKEKAEELYKQFRVAGWINDLSSDEQIPIVSPGDALTGGGFGNNEYGKASLGYLAMKDLLGDKLFKKCLHEYMNRWNGKHPLPWDFFNTFSNVAGKNLNWFWNNWFFGSGYIDYAVGDIKKSSGGYNVTIKNIGGFFAPVDMIVTYSDGTKETKHLTPSIWEKNAQQTKVAIATKKTIDAVSLDGGIFMDADESNNATTAGKNGF